MTPSEISLQILYEIAMSIGNSLDLGQMLQESLNAYLRKFNCAAGVVLQGKRINGAVRLEPVFSIPRRIEKNKAYLAALSTIPEQTPIDQVDANLRRLPLIGQHGDMHYHVMGLKDFGILILLKSRIPLDDYIVKSLLPLNNKLASACRACLRKDRIQRMASELRQENAERLKVESALHESHERLVTILDSLDVLIYVADIRTNEMIFMNKAMAHLFGADSIGQPCYEVIQAKDEPCTNCTNEALMATAGKSGGAVVWEDLNPVTDRWYVHHARAIKWIDGRWVRLQISTDVTQLKEMEEQRIKDAHLQQTRRLESLGILAGGIAHEFNNLLMSMLGNLSLITIDTHHDHPSRRYMTKIEHSIKVAARLTDQLLGYAQKGRYEDVLLQINPLIRSLSGDFSTENASIRVHLELDERLDQIEADRRQLEHVLSNLLRNAADAMPDGGRLFIRTANVKRGALKDKPYQMPVEDYVELRVKDTGKGMTQQVRERIFDPFYTTKPMGVGKGVGLGMAATYGIVKAHKGFIEVISTPGQGSEFIIYLPAAASPIGDAEGSDGASGTP